jgi:pimeloyl-ACP methyl ester carboxylesterase
MIGKLLAGLVAGLILVRTLRWARAQRGLPVLDARWDVVNGHRIFARTRSPQRSATAEDAATPVVLVHGLSMSSNYMIPIGRRLARAYRVYAPDFPGYGRSPHPPEPLTITALADMLCAWMDHMGIRQAHLLANSMGCQIAADFAQRYPERALKLVLIGPSMDPRTDTVPRLLLRGLINLLFESPAFYAVLLHDYIAAGMRETSSALGYSMKHPMAERVQALRQPALIVRGSHDWLVTQPWTEILAHLLPGGRLAVIPGGAHVHHFSQAERLEPLVLDFLRDGSA